MGNGRGENAKRKLVQSLILSIHLPNTMIREINLGSVLCNTIKSSEECQWIKSQTMSTKGGHSDQLLSKFTLNADCKMLEKTLQKLIRHVF